ncbi:hypothetical protein HRG_001523 [Hirsutella rhossiliensis]|uniref:Uncharacterized protein n=1 Tax=Hirsutella rhossiliensis TaxID=111463 RepID=A0A9P8SNB5_9HYPO|nr:uncharacterized protein HRG_01523 [Hirsutella rhossiliensis]KAH0968881.1 hypothetical protein HRG_01523 [Hirsutella rhossiliensis]
MRLDDKSPAWGYQGHAIRAHVAKTLNLGIERMPQIARVKTGWVIRASDREARDLLVERQDDWAARPASERLKASRTHGYMGGRGLAKLSKGSSPRQAPNQLMLHAAIQRRWRLLGTSRLARLIAKIGITTPATPATESRPADDVAGKTTVITTASTRRGARTAPNPFRQTDHKEYPARPRRSHGQLVRLTKIEKYAVRNIGSQQYQQVNMVLEGAESDDDAPEVRQRTLDCSVVLADAAHSCTSTGNISRSRRHHSSDVASDLEPHSAKR